MALQPQSHPPVVAREQGHGMRSGRHVPWFNPREMDDATVLQLSTGRDALLQQLLTTVDERLSHPGAFTHWLMTGSRGAGKSFFLRLVQASFPMAFGGRARFVLLPEEHRNIYASHEFLAEVTRMLDPAGGEPGSAPAWRVADPEQAWRDALANLLGSFAEPLLAIGVENFDELLDQAFGDDTDSARLRQLISNEPRIMLVATAVQGSFDEDYRQRMFRQFEHHPITPWDASEHREYLEKRADRVGLKPSHLQLARAESYSRYTGGNARAAAVLAGAILDQDDPLQAADDLDAAIEKMSDYYRALIDRIPPKTRKLFDALIRGGEPATQTEVAERTGARQNEISRAFLWLVDQGYVGESRQPGSRAKQYRVLDRLLVQFYRMRSLTPGQRSKLSVMADLLADTLAFREKWHYAQRYITEGQGPEALTLVKLALAERLVDIQQLPDEFHDTEALCRLGNGWVEWESVLEKEEIEQLIEILRLYPTDDTFRTAMEAAIPLATAASRGKVAGTELVPLLMGSLSLNPAEKFRVLVNLLSPKTSEFQWSELHNVFSLEVEKFKALEKDHPNDIQTLNRLLAEGGKYPRTVSLDDIAIRGKAGSTNYLKQFGSFAAANYAAEAALSWLQIGNRQAATASISNSLQIIQHLVEHYPHSEEILQLTAKLEPALPDLTAAERGKLREIIGVVQEAIGRYAEAYRAHALAREDALAARISNAAAWNLSKMAWCQGRMGKTAESLANHERAYAESLELKQLQGAAWNLGQMARHTAAASPEAAWELLDQRLTAIAGFETTAIQQLGDALMDAAGRDDTPTAFALGHGLLRGLAQRPQLPVDSALRGLWIDMVSMNVSRRFLRELLAEWESLFDYVAHPELPTLNQLLRDWLDDLDTPTEQRALRREQMDPELATTFTALEGALPAAVRRRLGLSGKDPDA